ncbi:NADH-quinone oxidoreductase subunit J family protein [Baekduia sp. Peel2402]|uniref:NADH-quinone oxidoreductase subunit J family protein n=1 Tax=Baekduia sp. Peel2402 TaxID=3458296 RepID=UPI00403EA62D
MAAVFFFIAGIGAIAGAIGVASVKNPFYAVLALVFHLLSLAALFLLLRAEFIAAAQVVVYAGAVMVLYVFVVAYVGTDAEPVRPAGGPGLRVASIVFAALLAVELLIAVLGSGLKAIDGRGAEYSPGFGSPAAIGELLLTRFLFPFEAASFLLLMAAVGAVVLARRRGGLEGADEEFVAPIVDHLPPGQFGTIAEGVGDTNPTATFQHAAITAAAEADPDDEKGW